MADNFFFFFEASVWIERKIYRKYLTDRKIVYAGKVTYLVFQSIITGRERNGFISLNQNSSLHVSELRQKQSLHLPQDLISSPTSLLFFCMFLVVLLKLLRVFHLLTLSLSLSCLIFVSGINPFLPVGFSLAKMDSEF